jgi:uncharacterized protein with HEPN domain
MKRDFRLFIEDILESMNKIEDYIRNVSQEEFNNSNIIFDAVIRNLEVIGEAAKSVPDEIREQYEFVPWLRMAGLRNILIHEYFGIDKQIVWKIVSVDLPNTKPLVTKVLSDI